MLIFVTAHGAKLDDPLYRIGLDAFRTERFREAISMQTAVRLKFRPVRS